MRLWNFKVPTFSGQSAHRWQWGCEPYGLATHSQEDFWYSFLLGAELTQVLSETESSGQFKILVISSGIELFKFLVDYNSNSYNDDNNNNHR
jgi:hypothetical protein